MRNVLAYLYLCSVFSALFCCPAFAQTIEDPKNSIDVFFGRYTTGSMGDSLNPFTATYEDNYLLAIACDRDFLNPGYRFRLGGEVGLASRFGTPWSAETWGGVVVRHRGITIRDWITIAPALTAGVSLISHPLGVEAKREQGHDGDATLLFYFGPEIAISLPRHPRWELVYRLHHRSGADGTLGNMKEGHNANTLGIRHRF